MNENEHKLTLDEVRVLRRTSQLGAARAAIDAIGFGERVARIECAFLDLEERKPFREILAAINEMRRDEDLSLDEKAQLALLAGIARNRNKDGEKAMDELLKAVDLFEEADNCLGVADAHDEMGVVLAWQGRVNLALTAYARAMAAWASECDMPGLAKTLGNLGRLYSETQQWRLARDFLKHAIKIRKSWGATREAVRLKINLAQADLGLGAYERALNLASEAGRECHAVEDAYLAFTAIRERALALVRLKAEEAALAVGEMKRAAGKSGGDYERASARMVEGEFLLESDPAAARDSLKLANRWFAENNLASPTAHTERLLAMAYLKLGQQGDAEAVIARAINRARKAGLTAMVRALKELQAELGLATSLPIEEGRTLANDFRDSEDGYVLRQVLGEGAYGRVYRAYDLEDHRDVALKTLHLKGLYDADRRRSLIASAKRELEATAGLDHPGIAKVYAFGHDAAGGHYVSQELIEGCTLRKLMTAEFEPGRFLDIMVRIAQALAALHDENVLHRDLKPENILMRNDEDPVLVDFGIAHLGLAGARADDRSGTPYYNSPEQYFGRALDGRSDLYSLGVVAFEWLTGEHPFRTMPPAWNILKKAALYRAARKRLRGQSARLPRAIEKLIWSLLAYDPAGRPASAKDFSNDLKAEQGEGA